ncbi:MAG: hypothetical protein WKG01_13320 [Kofleriaceae bacterium]
MRFWEQRWVDVAPSTHVFEIARVEARIAEIVRAYLTGRAREQILADLSRLFVSELGDWTAGWSWAVSSGGPVRHSAAPATASSRLGSPTPR